MSDFKGTPGPWLVCTTHSGTFVKSKQVAGYLAEVRHCRTTQDVNADARLIAAAPELLEACQTFAEWLRREEEGLPVGIVRGTPEGERQWRIWWEENLRICNLAQQQVRAAIAKATGGKP